MEKLQIFPSEINYEIIRKSHPYYSRSLCISDKKLQTYCEKSKYEIFQTWIAPQLSLNEIKERYANITFNDVVELSLVYNPIPESIKYYDRITCFYHSCAINQSHPELFLDLKDESSLMGLIDTIANICYKFNREDTLNSIASSIDYNDIWVDTFKVMTYRLRIKENPFIQYSIPDHVKKNSFAISRIMHSSLMFQPEEIFEYILIDAKLGVNLALRFVNYLQGGINNIMHIHENRLADTLVYIIGREAAESIFQYYFPGRSADESATISQNVGNSFYANNTYVRNSSLEVNIPDLVRLNYQLRYSKTQFDISVSDEYKAIYYITSGNYLDYLMWKRQGYKLISDPMYKYFTIAPWGIASLNTDLVKLYPKLSLDYPIGKNGLANFVPDPFTKLA